jgi:hypothetical protein
MKEVEADPNWALELQPVQVEVSKRGDVGYTGGTYVLTATDPSPRRWSPKRAGSSPSFASKPTDCGRAIQDINNAETVTSK